MSLAARLAPLALLLALIACAPPAPGASDVPTRVPATRLPRPLVVVIPQEGEAVRVLPESLRLYGGYSTLGNSAALPLLSGRTIAFSEIAFFEVGEVDGRQVRIRVVLRDGQVVDDALLRTAFLLGETERGSFHLDITAVERVDFPATRSGD
jgi:hypothetical protein